MKVRSYIRNIITLRIERELYMKRCRNCLLPENFPNVKLDDNRICNFCLHGDYISGSVIPKKSSSITKKEELKKDFENFVEKCRGINEYDCLLLFSGGKDSTYLLYLLKHHYKLNVLALTVDNGLLNPLAKQNIEIVVKKLNVEHLFFTQGYDFFRKLYRYYLTHPEKRTFCDKICEVCSSAIHSIGLNVAVKKKIPFVALAYSPDQIDNHFFEISKQELSQSWIPKELFNEYFSNDDRIYFWSPKNTDNFPRFFLPFHVIEYPSIEVIIKKVTKLGLISKRKASPGGTNCHLLWLLMYLDIKKSGYNPFVKSLSNLIRDNKIDSKRMVVKFFIGNWLLKAGVIKRKSIKRSLDYLNLSKKDILL